MPKYRTPILRKTSARASSKPRRKNVSSTAIVKAEVVSPTIIHAGRERELTQTEIDLVHRTVAKGTDADQFALFLWFCRKHGLDPVAKEVYCLLFQVTKHHQDFECPGLPTCRLGRGNESGMWHSGKEMVILTGIGGLRGLAARNHPTEYGSTDDPEYSFVSGKTTPSGKSIPDSCTVRVWKNGAQRPTSATVYWEEYAPNDLADDRAKFWRNMPKNQLAKCAEGQALKKAYPDLANIYVTEELARRISEQTPEGREIRYPQDRLKTGSHEAAQKVLEEKLSGQRPLHQPEAIDVSSQPDSHPAPSEKPAKTVGAPTKLPESAYHPENVPPANKPEPWKYDGTIEFDFSEDKTMPYVRGDIGGLIPNFPKDLTLRRKNDFWCCFAEDVERIKTVAIEKNFKITEIPARVPPSGKATTAVRGGNKGASESAAPVVVKGTLERVTSGMTSRNSPTRQVKIGNTWRTSYVNPIFDALDKGLGKEAELYVDARQNIVGLKRIGLVEYDADGRTPIIQRRDQEAGSKTLFGT